MMALEDIRSRVAPICKQYGIERAYLFGSQARGEADDSSDYDIRIECGQIRTLLALSGFRLDLMDALGKDVDVVSELPDMPAFRDNLRKDEVLLYEA